MLRSRSSLREYWRWNVGARADLEIATLQDGIRSLRRPPIVGRRRRILMIRSHHANAGLFAIFTFVLNQLGYAERHGYYPVVALGSEVDDKGGLNAYFDADHGGNVWEYFFEPVAECSAADIEQMLADPEVRLSQGDLTSLTSRQIWYLHRYERHSVFAYPYGRHRYKERYDASWYEHNRRRANELVQSYVVVKPDIVESVDAFHAAQMQQHRVLGLHMRGTDKGSARAAPAASRIVEPAEYVPHIDAALEQDPDCRLFCASDQQQFVDLIREQYGERVLTSDAIRCEGDLAPFQIADGRGYSKGREVLVDCLLLSRCDFLLKCSSHVGEAALWFNPDLPSLDLNYWPY